MDRNPLTPSLSPTGGEGARRAGEGAVGFKGARRDKMPEDSHLEGPPASTARAKPTFNLSSTFVALRDDSWDGSVGVDWVKGG